MTATIIAEDFAGMRTQGLGLAETAGWEAHFCPVHARPFWSNLSSRFWLRPLSCIEPIALPPQTNVLIGVGGTGGIIGRALARKYHLPIVQIQNPRRQFKRFDVIIANPHDGIAGENILISRNALHPVTPQKLESARQQWHSHLRRDHRPLLAVMIGGANGRFTLGPREAAHMADTIIAYTQHHNMQTIVTPSRRTGADVITVLREHLTPHGIRLETGEGDANPYMGMLACADMIAVTTDSVSMISEAVATPAPVMILPLPGRSQRIGQFIAALEKDDRIRPFSIEHTSWTVRPLDDTPDIAREMRRRLKL
ncbi:mitochondrial fission ELM1 family protein [Neokomagataea anthophila]|uniref:Mitochondrial fission ELM1 family protein n=1 Tax=Neokomagataea anthophila TaxID=2826925 RepID=A0ABS5E6Y1_9PROT|nr:mitochondrial fission ELM1 family protein [Neokomagataea anthophila]MBR0559677.1 mitochondrial fission ELM1 family protein [Neokomagataea anthophila]